MVALLKEGSQEVQGLLHPERRKCERHRGLTWRSERSFKRNELISVTASPSSAFLKTVGQNIYKEHSSCISEYT